MSRLPSFAFFASLLACGLASATAHADTITFTLNSPTQTVTAGGTATYYGIISAPASNTNSVYVESQSITFGGPQDVAITDDLFANFQEVFNPGDTAYGVLFTIDVPLGETPGVYTGFDVLQGGATYMSQDILGAQPFSLNVAATTTTVTPEPPAYLLLITGVLGIWACETHRRRRLVGGID